MIASSHSKPLHLGIFWNHSLCPKSSKDSWDSKFVPLSWHKLSDKTAKKMGEIRNFSPRGGFDAWKMDPTNQWMEWGTHAPLSDKAVYLPHLLLPHTMYYLCRATVCVSYVSQCWTQQRWGVKTLWRFVRRKNWRCWPTSIRWVWSLNGGQNEEKPRLGVETALRMVGFP